MMFYKILIGDIVRFIIIYIVFLIGFAQGRHSVAHIIYCINCILKVILTVF